MVAKECVDINESKTLVSYEQMKSAFFPPDAMTFFIQSYA